MASQSPRVATRCIETVGHTFEKLSAPQSPQLALATTKSPPGLPAFAAFVHPVTAAGSPHRPPLTAYTHTNELTTAVTEQRQLNSAAHVGATDHEAARW